MTDKQIIIDGVDVSGCEWIREVGLDSEYICTCNSPNKTSGYCKYNPNCRYKELKAKEQECEELVKNNKYEFDETLLQYSNEIDNLKTERDDYIDKYFLESQKVLSLNKVLKDIKTIAEHCMKQDICTTCDNSDRCYIEDEEIPTYDVCKLILQKIKEVEDGQI